MIKTFTKILPLALLFTAASNTMANSVETTMTFALKFSYMPSLEYTETPSSFVRTQKVVTIKNADLIAYFNEINSEAPHFPFPSNAKIIRIDNFASDADHLGTKFVLRHKNGDEADITAAFEWASIASTATTKYSKKTDLGVSKDLIYGDFLFEAGRNAIEGTTLGTTNYKDVLVKGTESSVSVATFSQALSSAARFKVPEEKLGVAAGIIKASGPKIFPATPK
jgi:hypothetical protein